MFRTRTFTLLLLAPLLLVLGTAASDEALALMPLADEEAEPAPEHEHEEEAEAEAEEAPADAEQESATDEEAADADEGAPAEAEQESATDEEAADADEGAPAEADADHADEDAPAEAAADEAAESATEEQAEEHVPAVLAPIATPTTTLRRADPAQLLADVRELPLDAAFLSLPAAAAGLSPQSAEAALQWVRTNFRVEPGEGQARGARGTLFSLAGNPLELSLLLGALLTELRQDWRIASASLGSRELGALLRVMNPAARLPGSPADAALYDPDEDVRRQSSLRTHYWVEVRRGGNWIALDPSIPVLPAGESLVPAERWLSASEVSESLGAWVTIQLRPLQDGRPGSPLLSRRLPLASVVFRNLGVAWHVDTATNQVRAKVDLGDESVALSALPLRGLNALLLEVSVETGSLVRTQAVPLPLFEAQGRPWLDARHSLVIAPGMVTATYLQGAMRGIGAEIERAHAALAGEATPAAGSSDLQALLANLAGLRALAALHHADFAADTLGRALGIRPVIPQARVLVSSVQRSETLLSAQANLWGMEPDAFPAEGVPVAFGGAFHGLLSRYVDLLLSSDEARRPLDTLELATVHTGNSSALNRLTTDPGLRAGTTQVLEAGDVALLIRSAEAAPDALWAVRRGSGAVVTVNASGLRHLQGPQFPVTDSLQRSLDQLLVASLSQALAETRRNEIDSDLLCRAQCEANRIAPRMCADESERPPLQFTRCLGTGASGAGSTALRSLRGAQTCSSSVRPAACGALVANTILSGRGRVVYESESITYGRWSSIRPASHTCDCRP